MEQSDRELVRKASRGDDEAFRELFDRYHRQILALAIGMTGSRDDAMDAVQETFVRAHRRLDSFQGESSFYTWLYRIAVNVVIDQLRGEERRRRRIASDFEVADLPAGRRDDPVASRADAELRRRLAEGIDELTPEHKAAIVLREIEGLSYEEISRVMECSKGTVMSRLHYARKKLQGKLRDLL